MQFTFIDMAGKTLFLRDDAERATLTHEEMSLDAEFPYFSGKKISIGQRIYFKSPSTNTVQIYEVKQAKSIEPDHYQSIVAEHICISELSDEHIDSKELDNVTVKSALTTILSGTLWSVGNVGVNPKASVDISRGSVWQGVLELTDNFNVYIEPRVTLSADGTITRLLDVKSTDGVWRGLRLSIDKNMLDPSVTYDDSEVATALYGYGGTKPAEKSGEEDEEITFKDIAWSNTADHPAKPKGQTYLEDPTATAKYGRNGRARFGFYQNTDILDPEILLQKTWETLKTVSKPAISIEGTVADLRRMGYVDTPIYLHDIALVEVSPVGYKDQIQIIRLTEDLLDPSATTLTIGAYIPNIIYIQRDTNEQATGSRGGGGGNKSEQTVRSEYETQILKNNREIKLRAYQNDLDDLDNEVKLQEAYIDIQADRITAEVAEREKKDGEIVTNYTSLITQTAREIRAEVRDNVNGLNSKIVQQANKISLVVSSDNKIKSASIVAQMNRDSSSISISADCIDIDGLVKKLESEAIGVGSLHVEGRSEFLQPAYFEAGLSSDEAIKAPGFEVGTESITYNGHTGAWKSATLTTYNLSDSHAFMYKSGEYTPTILGRLVTSTATTTIHYFGY